MKKIIYTLLFLSTIIMAACSGNSRAKNFDSIENDSIKKFYTEIFEVTKGEYLYRDSIDIDAAIKETKEALTKYRSFKKSLDELPGFFERIKCDHCSFFRGKDEYYPNVEFPPDSIFTKALFDKFETKPEFEAKVLDNKYGYILMPGMIFDSFDEETLSKVASQMYNKIYDIKSKHNIKAWIIDLRLNEGGTAYPMLLALYDFFGDSVIFKYLDKEQKVTSTCRLKEGKLYDRIAGMVAQLTPKGKMLLNEKVAILIGPATASSGEITAISFKGRPNTIFIGENTAGATTVNAEIMTIYDGSLALTTGYDTDRNGVAYKIVEPDVLVIKQENFVDLLKDQKVAKAIEYFNE